MTLRETIMKVIGKGTLTYREITDAINKERLYVPRDGMLVPQPQVRATIRESNRFFEVDESTSPHEVRVHI